MRTLKILLLALAGTIIIVGCKTSKKSSGSATSTTPVATTSSPPSGSLVRSVDGIYPPGNEELSAIQVQFKDVTLAKLEEGYTLYAKGACVSCHAAQNIYIYEQWRWLEIIEDMARKARITDGEKDAVTKYVFAIKATQPKTPK